MTSKCHESEARIKKRKYSRRGCLECKRRKIKCDEALPECFNCTRLHKKCSYPAGAMASEPTPSLSMGVSDPNFMVRFYKPKPEDKDGDSCSPSSGHAILPGSVPSILPGSVPSSMAQIQPSLQPSLQSQVQSQVQIQASPSVGQVQNQGQSQINSMGQIASIGSENIHPLGVPERSTSMQSSNSMQSINSMQSMNSIQSINSMPNSTQSMTSILLNQNLPNLPHLNPPPNPNISTPTLNPSLPNPNLSSASIRGLHNPQYMEPMFTSLDLDTSLVLGHDLDLRNLYNEANSLVNDIHGFLDGSESLRLEKSIWEEVKMEEDSSSLAASSFPKRYDATRYDPKGYENDPKGYENDLKRSDLKAYDPKQNEPDPKRYENDLKGYDAKAYDATRYDKRYEGDTVSISSDRYEPRDYAQYSGSPANSGLIAEISAKANLDASHINYLQTLTNTNLSYHLFPFASSIETNEVIKILLNYSINCEYLLNSLLAITATFQFNQSGDRTHETSRQRYIKQCFVALSAAFKENLGFQNTWIFTNNVEKLLLTVLVLSSNFTACSNSGEMANQWIAHLKGARDLLLNYSKIKRKDESTNMSSGLALAKCWFFAIESSAAIHSCTGGSLSKNDGPSSSRGSNSSEKSLEDTFLMSEAEHQRRAVAEHVTVALPEDIYKSSPQATNDDETSKLRQIFQDTGKLDETVNSAYCHALERAQLLTHHKFNLYWGYSSAIAGAHMKYASVVEETKTRGLSKVGLRWTSHLLGVVDACSQELMVPQVKMDTFEIPAGTRGHPDYQGNDKLVLKASCYIQESGIYRSWFDMSNQFHCDDLYIKILTGRQFMALPRSHPDVQSIVHKVFKGSFFIREKPVECQQDVIVESQHYYLSKKTFDERCIMIQSIFRALSGIVQGERDFERVELFYLGLVKLGNGSSLTSLDMLTKCRKRREKKRRERKKGVDEDVYDLYEASSIPFA